jgi:2-methylcitrate dehydratase
MRDDTLRQAGLKLGRRHLMRLSAGLALTALSGKRAFTQAPPAGQTPAPRGSTRAPGTPRPHTAPGYTNHYNRLGGNGPMDDHTRRIVRFVRDFNESRLTPSVVDALNRTLRDSMACMVAGFEQEPVRIAARLARQVQPGELKATVLGYGIATSPELATFANSVMVRVTDFNDNAPGGHNSDLIPAALALGEALHKSGAEVMTAITIGYEIKAAQAGGEPVAAAMAAGKLMGLDEDRLANAVGMALVPHVALNKGVGAMSMWKGVRSAEATKNGVWAALLAREGMTGPPQPFEGRGSLWALRGRPRAELRLPVQDRLCIERTWFKRFPSDAQSQGFLVLVPEMRAWTKVEEIASIQYDMTHNNWQEVGGAAKWDPRNPETADHSAPYLLARGLIDGDIYVDSFVDAKYPYRDSVVKALMDKITCAPVDGWGGLGTARITIRKTSGETRSWDTWGGARNPSLEDYPRLTNEEIKAKFDRACAFRRVSDGQRDRAWNVWGNVRSLKDISEAMQTLASFGRPQAL